MAPTSERILTNMANYRAGLSDERKEANKLAAKLRMRAKRTAAKLAAAQANPQPPAQPSQAVHDAIETPRSTRGQQLSRVKRMAIGMGETFTGNNTWLHNANQVISYLSGKYKNADTRRSYLSAAVFFLRDKDNVPEEELAKYRAAMNEHILAIETRIGENTKSAADKAAWMSWPKIKAKQREVKKWNDPLQETVFGLYVSLPPRHTDYNDMKVREYSIRKFRTWSKSENVVWMTRGFKRVKMISLSKYKGSDQKGIYTTAKAKDGTHGAKPPALLANPLTRLISGKGEGDFVFPEQYRDPRKFSALVGDVFEKATGKRITINTLRKIWATYQASGNPTQNEKAKLARTMGTSIRMFDSAYRKV
jgi:hypothetical protein